MGTALNLSRQNSEKDVAMPLRVSSRREQIGTRHKPDRQRVGARPRCSLKARVKVGAPL